MKKPEDGSKRANGRRSVPQILLMVSTKVDVMTCIEDQQGQLDSC